MESLRNVTHVLRATMLVSLLQPSPETFDLFDDVILLANGRVVFHGPREFVLPFFEGLGFGIPPRRGLADFLQEVTIPTDQEKFWDSERHGKPFRFITPASMQSEFQETEPWRRMMAELAQPYPRTEESRAALAWSKYGQPPFELLRALARRTWLLQKRTKIFAIIRTFQVGLMAFLTATVFWREDKNNVDDGQFFMGVLFYSLLYQVRYRHGAVKIFLQG